MYVKKSLMLWAALLALALPLIMAGTASAKYFKDGAVQNDVTGGWKTPNDMMCIVGVHTDGTLDIADGVTNARDCIYLQTGTMNGGTAFDLTAIPTSALCTSATNTYTGAKHSWATTFCTKSLKGLDRTQKMCEGIGGTWVTTGKCVAYGRQFKGQDATGTPLAVGTKGTVQAAGTGYCYAAMNMTSYASTTAACPSNQASVAPFNTNAAYDWAFSAGKCTYSKGIAGYLSAALTKADATTYAANSFLNMSTFTTMGDCLANGGSWANWIGQAASTTSIPTTPLASTIPAWDYKTQVPDADNGCLHCHSTLTEYNGPAEREKDSYLKTGHKNMLRKVTAGKNWAGPDGVVYSAYAAGTLNFSTATAQVSGVDKPLLYIFGDWMAAAPAGLDVIVDMGTGTGGKYNGTSNYSCAACHTTGWSNNDGTSGLCNYSSKTTKATCEAVTSGTFGIGVWYPMTGVEGIGDSTYVPQEPATSFPGITFTGAGKWDNDGIMCGRCHNAAVGPITAAAIAASPFPNTVPTGGGMGNLGPQGPTGTWATKLCFGCHQSMAKTSDGTGTDADLNHPENLPVKNSDATNATYKPMFNGHVLGNSFLNSPHSRATATVAPNALGKYDLRDSFTSNSAFKGYNCFQSATSTSPAKTQANGTEIKDKATCEGLYGAGAWRADVQGNCTTCHDVHNSLFVAGQEGLRKECGSCHENLVYQTDVPGATQVDSAAINHPKVGGTPFDASLYTNACEVCHMPKPTAGDFPMHVWRINADAAYSTFPTSAEFNGICSNATYTISATCTGNGGTWTAATRKNANVATDGSYANAVWVDLDLACGQCHGGSGGSGATQNGAPYFNKTILSNYAKDMHKAKPATAVVPSFVWTASNTIQGQVTFNASASICPTGNTCTSTWDFGDASTGSGATITHVFAMPTATTTYNVKLTVTVDGYQVGTSMTKTVYPLAVNNAPVASGNNPALTGSTYAAPATSPGTVSFTDTSTDADSNIKTVSVNWGDGIAETQNAAGGTFTHNYTRAMKYTIIHTVRDATGLSSFEKAYVKIVPPTYVISGTVATSGGAPVDGVFLSLRINGHTKTSKITDASGTFTFPAQLPKDYTLKIYKRGYTFSNPGTITLTGATTLNITATPNP